MTTNNADELLKEVLRPGSSFYYSTLHLKQSDKKKISIIFCLFKEWLSLHNNSKEPQVAHTALHWWLEQVDHFSASTALDAKSNQTPHPLMQQLTFLHGSPELRVLVCERMKLIIVALIQNQYSHQHDDLLEQFLRETWGNFCVLSSLCLSEVSSDAIAIQQQTGLLIGYHNLFKDLGRQLSTQRCALPQSWLKEWDITHAQLVSALKTDTRHASNPKKPPEKNLSPKILLLEKIQQITHQQQTRLEMLLAKPSANNSVCLSSLKAYVFESALLQLTVKQNFQIFEYRLQLAPIKKLWLGWRCKRYYKSRHFQKMFTRLKIR